MSHEAFRISAGVVVSTILIAAMAACKTPASAPEPQATLAPIATATIPVAAATIPATPALPGVAWRDGLDGKADSGAATLTTPGMASPVPSAGAVSWVPGTSGQAALLGVDDAYIGYLGSRLGVKEGTITFKYKPIANLAGAYATKRERWTDSGQYKAPQSGFMLDTAGWGRAPTGALELILDPSAAGGLTFGVWDGSKWHNVSWKTPAGWQWDSDRWYEIGVTWGAGGMGVLVDGQLVASIPDVVSVSNSNAWFLGQAPGYAPYGPHTMMGTYDEVRVSRVSSPLVAAPSSAPTTPAPAGRPAGTPLERRIKEPIKATVTTQSVSVGTLASNGVQVLIPAGAVEAGAVVTLVNPEKIPAPDPRMAALLGAPVEISAGGNPVRLQQFVTVTLKLDKSALRPDETDLLRIGYFNPVTQDWEYFMPDKVDLDGGTVTFTVDHLSVYSEMSAAAEELIEEKARSKALAGLATEHVLDKVADQVVDHILKDRLGLSEDSTSSQVLSLVLKDKDYSEIKEKFQAGDSEEAMQKLTMLAAKNVVQAVEGKNLSEALMKATRARRFGAEAHETLRKKLVEAAGETPLTRTLKEISGAGTLNEWGLDLNTATDAAGHLAEGNVREATRIIGESVADKFLIGKLGKVGVEVVQSQIDSWKDEKLEAAYQAWKNGASDKGYPLDAKGNIDEVWVKMGDSLRRQVNVDAINQENKIRRDGGLPPLTEREADVVRARAARELEAQWRERAGTEEREAKIRSEIDAMLDSMHSKGVIDASWMGWSDPPRSYEWKVRAILSSWDIISNDLAGQKAKTPTGRLSQTDIGDMIVEMWSQKNLSEGRKAYAELLFKRFGIDVRAKYGVAVAAPTATPTKAAIATPKEGTRWLRTGQRQLGPEVAGAGVTGEGSLTGSTIATSILNYVKRSASKWTCTWPDPPGEMVPGKVWSGSMSVADAGSKQIEPRHEVTGFVDIVPGNFDPVGAAYTQFPGKLKASADFSWEVPRGSLLEKLEITVTCQAQAKDFASSDDGAYSRMRIKYMYEWR